MIKDYLQTIDGVSIYPIISMIVFVLFFAAVLIWISKLDKKYINRMENLPLEKDEENNFNKTGNVYEKKV
ncbi:MAG TPA: cbb3-type cytochrome c oxidase subunit 3 [Ignavibacteriaceae bacterium]|mgnify:CR=1 FL=1|nr:cbb3-type cytochrome c oxidase subunit 3 [Ignavibacteriaceae bacterium]